VLWLGSLPHDPLNGTPHIFHGRRRSKALWLSMTTKPYSLLTCTAAAGLRSWILTFLNFRLSVDQRLRPMGREAVCVFVNDVIDERLVFESLGASQGVEPW